jgi:hypothetical protein
MAANALAADPPAIVSRIPRYPVQSSALASVGYSKRLRVLEVEFTNGAVYRYVGVPRRLYHDLMSAESKARFYHANIKKKFRSVRVRSHMKENSRN